MRIDFSHFIKKQKAAFTLVELVLVLGIFVVVLGLSLRSLVLSQSSQIFNNNFSKLHTMINTARSLAIAGKGQLDYTDFDNDALKDDNNDYVVPAHYGLHFDLDNKEIKLFADIHPPTSEPISGEKGQYDGCTKYSEGCDLVLDSYIFPKHIELEIIDENLCNKTENGTPRQKCSFFYNPKYADISFDDGIKPNPFVILKLNDTNTKACRQIKIHELAGIPEVMQCEN